MRFHVRQSKAHRKKVKAHRQYRLHAISRLILRYTMLVRHVCICTLTAHMRCIFEAKNDEMKENKNPLLLETEKIYQREGQEKQFQSTFQSQILSFGARVFRDYILGQPRPCFFLNSPPPEGW